MTDAHLFDANARFATERHTSKLDRLCALTCDLLPGDAVPRIYLSRPLGFASAQTLNSYGTVFIADEFLTNVPQDVIEAVAVHEAVHLLVGCDVCHTLREKHHDVVVFLHDTIISGWFRGQYVLRADDKYLDDKGWRQLYAGWNGPTHVLPDSACDADDMYFALFKEGLVFAHERGVFSGTRLMQGSRPIRPVPVLAPGNVADGMILVILTGLELAAYLDGCIKATLSIKHGVDFTTVEEAFANYVATTLTGVPLDRIQQWAPQDEVKISIAKQLLKTRPSIDKLREGSMTCTDLVEVARGAGLVHTG